MPAKIGFVLLSNTQQPMPSTRIAALNMFPFLSASGFEPQVVYEPKIEMETPDITGLHSRLVKGGFKIIVFQKVHGASVEKLVRLCSETGIKTVYIVCDLVNVAMVEATDVTIVVTDYLKSLYPAGLHSKIHVVHDGLENSETHKEKWTDHTGSRRRPIKAVLVTSAGYDRLPLINVVPDWLEVTIVGRYPSKSNIIQRLRETRWNVGRLDSFQERLAYFRFLANRRIFRVPWGPLQVYQWLRDADIGIIPIETGTEQQESISPPAWKVKSENRLTMKMCVGLPVIATPIPAYELIIEQGVNGFLARSGNDWAGSLEALRDPKLRKTIGMQARESVVERFSMQEQARQLVRILNTLCV